MILTEFLGRTVYNYPIKLSNLNKNLFSLKTLVLTRSLKEKLRTDGAIQ